MQKIIILTEEELENLLDRVLERKIKKHFKTGIDKTFSINQVAKMLKRSHQKITSLVASGILKTTADNRIYESSLQEYIQK